MHGFEWLRVDGENFAAAPLERILSRSRGVILAAVYAVPDVEVGDQVMAALQLREPDCFDAKAFSAFLDAQPDLGTKWTPRYLRLSKGLPVTQTSKARKRLLLAERWECDEPVFWSPGKGEAYRRITPTDVVEIQQPVRLHRTGFFTRKGRVDSDVLRTPEAWSWVSADESRRP